MSNLNNDQEEILAQFQEISAVDDRSTAIQVLSRCNWNLELAIQEYINHTEGRPSAVGEHHSSDDGSGNEAPPPVINRSSRVNNPVRVRRVQPYRRLTWGEWCYGLVTLPLRFAYSTFLDLFKFLYGFIFPQHRAVTDPVGDVTAFITSYEQKYGPQHPVFYRGSYSMALDDAKKELRFLLIYLHADDHQDTDEFCRNTLGDDGFIEFINHNALFWACSVKSPEGHRVSRFMHETTYPFFALVCLRENRMMVVLRHEGLCRPDEAIGFLAIAIQNNDTYLNIARQERQQHQMNQMLRQEQEQAYRAGLLADQERDRRITEERDRLKREEEALAREAQEKEQRKEQLLAERERIRDNLPPEPDAADAGCVRVSLKFPSGARVERRFLEDDSLQLLWQVAFVHPECPDDFSIVTNFPRKVLECRGADVQTFGEAGLQKAVLLLILDNEA